MTDPSITVVIPSYNRAHCISNAVATVRAQEMIEAKSIEIIVVDDGSKDNTLGVLTKLQRHDPYLQIIRHTKNKGVNAARNTGLGNASGEYVAFLDSDDTWQPRKLHLQLLEITASTWTINRDEPGLGESHSPTFTLTRAVGASSSPNLMCLSYYQDVDAHNRKYIPSCFLGKYGADGYTELRSYTDEELARESVTGDIWLGIGSTLFAHRETFKSNGWFKEDLGYGEEREYLIRHILRGNPITAVPFALMNYTTPARNKPYAGEDIHYQYMTDTYRCLVAQRFGPEAAEKFIENMRWGHRDRARERGKKWSGEDHQLTITAEAPCNSGFECSLRETHCGQPLRPVVTRALRFPLPAL